jgi:pantothenate synthetase
MQALSIVTSLRKVEEAVRNGNVNVSSLVNLVKQEITIAYGKVDYVEVSDFHVHS